MNKVKNRTIIALFLVLLLTAGIVFYTLSYVKDGIQWASFASNKSVFTSGKLTRGKIVDRNGVLLLQNTSEGKVYNQDPLIRTANLHVVGDRNGNIGSSVARKYAALLTGFDPIQGCYSFSDSGTTVTLTLDAELCADAYKALDGRKGCVMIVNYKTGEIPCMVSTPTFDPDNVPSDLETNSKYLGAYMNRCLSSTFTPGSIFKLITTACAIDNIDGLFDIEFECSGSCEIGGDQVNCQGVHGKIKIGEALAKSCNCAFAELSLMLGSDLLQEYAERFGLTASHSFGELITAQGNFDAAEDDFELAWSGIGQSTDLVCPSAMLRAVAAIANNGEAVTPHILKSEGSSKERIISEKTAQTLTLLMSNNVTNNYGQANYPGLDLCAKSGTAEVGGDSVPHAWFTGFIRRDDAPLAFIVFIENGGSGSANAGKVANTVLQSAVSRLSDQVHVK